jgi:hypothetical protein
MSKQASALSAERTSAYARSVGRTLLARLHNPGYHACACLASCWCRRTRIGAVVRWYTPGRFHRTDQPFGCADVTGPPANDA